MKKKPLEAKFFSLFEWWELMLGQRQGAGSTQRFLEFSTPEDWGFHDDPIWRNIFQRGLSWNHQLVIWLKGVGQFSSNNWLV